MYCCEPSLANDVLWLKSKWMLWFCSSALSLISHRSVWENEYTRKEVISRSCIQRACIYCICVGNITHNTVKTSFCFNYRSLQSISFIGDLLHRHQVGKKHSYIAIVMGDFTKGYILIYRVFEKSLPVFISLLLSNNKRYRNDFFIVSKHALWHFFVDEISRLIVWMSKIKHEFRLENVWKYLIILSSLSFSYEKRYYRKFLNFLNCR